jgi:hypothetical protein
MPTRRHAPTVATTSLATARAGQYLCIRRILFDQLRRDCERIGLHEGERIHCRRSLPATLLLETETHRSVVVPRDWARFISVADVDSCDISMS